MFFYVIYATIYTILFHLSERKMKTLQIIFCILSCICVAASVFLGIFLGWEWFFLAAALAIVFGAGMFFVKAKGEPPEPKKDFLSSDSETDAPKKETDDK